MDDLKGKVSIYKPNDFNHYVIKLHLESFEYGMSKNFTSKEDLSLLLGLNDILYKKLAKEYNGKFNSKYGICFYDPEDGENFLLPHHLNKLDIVCMALSLPISYREWLG